MKCFTGTLKLYFALGTRVVVNLASYDFDSKVISREDLVNLIVKQSPLLPSCTFFREVRANALKKLNLLMQLPESQEYLQHKSCKESLQSIDCKEFDNLGYVATLLLSCYISC